MKGCPAGVPWYRVVNASGGISLRANVGGMITQRMLLEREGVRLRRGRVPLREYRWGSRPAVARGPSLPGGRIDQRPGARGSNSGAVAKGASRQWSGAARAGASPGALAR
jgi:hypothetical protein